MKPRSNFDATGRDVSIDAPVPARIWPAMRSRLDGPGGYYNIGNAIGLLTGLGLQAAAMAGDGGATASATELHYFSGTGSSTALMLATLIFFISGEIYHRAWARSGAPDPALNRVGDFLSGVGALALGVALFGIGQPVLAATAGLMHAAGKFGSAFHRLDSAPVRGWPAAWPDPFRSLVLVSRIPAGAAACWELVGALLPGASGNELSNLVEAATLLACTLLWAKADLLLFDTRRERPLTLSPLTVSAAGDNLQGMEER